MKLELKTKLLDVGTGGVLVALLDDATAIKLDVFAGDRIRVSSGNKSVICTVDIAKHADHDIIGLYYESADLLRVRQGQKVAVTPAPSPLSVPLIRAKLHGSTLSEKDMLQIVEDISTNKLTSLEIAYFVSAAYTQGFSVKETYNLAKAMINTGDKLSWGNKVVCSKHCIGGITGNRTTMIVVPIVTAAGLLMPKTSSRAITSPAGTADTMELLAPVSFSRISDIKKVVEKTDGCIIWGGSLDLAPADDKIINAEHPLGLDPTPMLLASILSKKVSEGANHVLIDIPVGKYSKITDVRKYYGLREQFLELGKMLGIKIEVVKTCGDGPVGRGFGPALEAIDVLRVLHNDKLAPQDLRDKSVCLAGILLEMGGKARKGEGAKIAYSILKSGAAWRKMQDIIKAQGGNPDISPKDIELGSFTKTARASKDGKVRELNDDALAKMGTLAGAPKDKGAGVYLHVLNGQKVNKGDPLFTIYSNSDYWLAEAGRYAKSTDIVRY